MQQKIFFAYESGHPENIDALKKGALEYNKHQKTYHVQTWEDLKINGSVINSCIFEAIDKCSIFACDLTYQNHNVLFELGYAIAKEKQLLILLNDTVAGAKEGYSGFKILKNVGYTAFSSSKQVNAALQKKVHLESVFLNQLVNVENLDHNTHDIFFMNSKIENQASIELAELFQSEDLRILSNNTSEIEYQPLLWYITNIYKAKNILLHMVAKDKLNSHEFNAEYSFFAGIGYGLNKKVLLVAPTPFNAPIDYSDILIEYYDSEECRLKVRNWIEIQKRNKDIPEREETKVPDINDKKDNLLKLGIGYEIAEEEGHNLLDYFIEYDSYKKAFSRSSSIFVGRKGSGKSALFIKLLSDYKDDKDIYNVIIKPDSDELLDNVEFSRLYNNERSKKAFLLATWKFVFLSKLLNSIVHSFSGKIHTQINTSIEYKLLEFYKEYENILDLNFYGVVNFISSKTKEYSENPEILGPINNDYINPIIHLLSVYFKEKKYKKIHLLCDNLDKAWDSKNDLSLQSDMILALLEFSGKIKSILKNDELTVSTIVFLRKDIHDFILKGSREPDKITIKSSFIDWSKHPQKLLEIVEERFRYSLSLNDDYNINDVWNEYFEFENPGKEILKYIVPRPRDVIYFVSRLFESAINFDIEKVNKECLKYAIEEYSTFLHNNLIAETKAEFPEIDSIMSKILLSHYGETLSFEEFMLILNSETNNESRDIDLLKSLFKKQYVVGIDVKGKHLFSEIEKLLQKVNEKKFFFFKKNKIYILLHPRRYMKILNHNSSF